MTWLVPLHKARADSGRRDVRDRRLGRAGNDQRAGGGQKRAACFAFKLSPDFVRANGERRVLRAFADRETRDPRVAVRRALDVRWRKTVEAKDVDAAPGKLKGSGAAHRTEAEDDRVESIHAEGALACEIRDRAHLAGQRKDVEAGVRAIDGVDVAAIIDLDVVRLDRNLAAIGAVDFYAARIGLSSSFSRSGMSL